MRAFILILCLLPTLAFATEERFVLETTQQQEWFLELTAELRCPKCQNQNIADSNAVVSQDMKRKVHQLLSQGQNKQEILAYMKQRYGNFVHYKPPVTLATLMLWLLPICFLLLGLSLIWFKGRKQKAVSSQQELEQAELLLKSQQSEEKS